MKPSYQLLLNLVMREYLNWYYFEIPPRYDRNLLLYMQSCDDEHFVRFDLTNIGQIVYVPLKYRSLTGMHLFSSNMAVRKEKTQELSSISYEDAILLIVQNISPEYTKERLKSDTQHIIYNYMQKQMSSLESIVPSAKIKKREVNLSNSYIPVQNLFNEYGNAENFKDFQSLLNVYIEKSDLSQEESIIEWVKTYCSVVSEKSLQLFSNEDTAVSSSLHNTAMSFTQQNMPKDIVLMKGIPYVNRYFKESDFNEEKIKNFVRASLLNHHLYPLIRAIGLLGLSSERQLLEIVTDVLRSVQGPFKGHLDLFGVVRTRVTAYIPELLSIPMEYSSRQVHIYNFILDKAYYSYKLMKPKPGEIVHKRYFKNEDETIEIGIRGFNIETDLEILHEWVNLEYAKKFWEMDGPIEDLEEAYIKHLGVDYSHPYIGTLDGEPIFTLELYWAVKDEVGKYYPFHPGDYGFHMLIAPAKRRIPKFSFHALTMCMEHFFSFKEVHRMIGEASATHTGTHNLITKVGCEFDKALVLPYKTSNLTFLNREMYHNTVKDVLEYSSLNPF